jgi:hypothetical protein
MVSKFDQKEYLKEVFSRFMPEWNWYALEIHLLSYMLHYGPLNEKVVYHSINTYLEKHAVYSLLPEVSATFKKNAESFFLPMIHWTLEEGIDYLLTFWNTWDYYEIGLRFLYLYVENRDQVNYPTYIDHLLSLIQANPEKRPNVFDIRNTQEQVISSFELGNSLSSYPSIDKVVVTETLEKN